MMKQRNCLLLAAVLVLCLCACGKKEAPEPTATLPTKAAAPAETTAPAAVETTVPAAEVRDTNFYAGTWTVTGLQANGVDFTAEQATALGMKNLDIIQLILMKDGHAQMKNGDETISGIWIVTENGIQFNSAQLPYENNHLAVSDSKMTLYFEKQSDSQELPTAATEAPTEPETTESASGIRPEFKEAMDSYEAFYDEYFAFMAEYKKNPTDLSLLMKYTSMLSKVADMDKTFNAMDQGDMTPEELKYYLEVHTRIQKKLIDLL